MLKDLIRRAKEFVTTKEPVAVLNAVAALITAVAVEVRGDATSGKAGWIAVGWAALAVLTRQLVTPATRR